MLRFRGTVVGVACLLVPVLVCVLSAGCAVEDAFGIGGQKPPDTLTLISNQENTRFAVRAPGGPWREVGTGKILDIAAPLFPCEVEARPVGYRTRSMTLSRQVSEVRFTFEISDADGYKPAATAVAVPMVVAVTVSDERPGQPQPQPQKPLRVEADVRILSVASAAVVASTGASAEGAGALRECMDKCAKDVAACAELQGKRIAVLSLKEGTNAESLGTQAQGMLISSLSGSGVQVVEREQLSKILGEHDLRESDVVDSPARLGGVMTVDYVLVGSISRMDE